MGAFCGRLRIHLFRSGSRGSEYAKPSMNPAAVPDLCVFRHMSVRDATANSMRSTNGNAARTTGRRDRRSLSKNGGSGRRDGGDFNKEFSWKFPRNFPARIYFWISIFLSFIFSSFFNLFVMVSVYVGANVCLPVRTIDYFRILQGRPLRPD